MQAQRLNTYKGTVIETGAKDARLSRRYTTSKIRQFEKVQLSVFEKLKNLESASTTNRQSIERCVCIVAQCQQQMAKIIGRDIERFALHPAIEAVVALADEIVSLTDIVEEEDTLRVDPQNPFEIIRQQIHLSASIAKDKLNHLGIAKIRPLLKEAVDPVQHDICTCTQTDDKNLHGRISGVLSEGIVYRGDILKQAKVSAYRCSDTSE